MTDLRPQLVLSLFPGIGMLDYGFELEGFCVVRGPDVLWGGDIRGWHPPAGKFDGVIGGPPCQAFSSLANLVRAKGLEPRFGNLIPEFSRVVEETQPDWFLMENVPKAPDPTPAGYNVTPFLLDNCWLGEAQMRKRKFWFGVRGEHAPYLLKWIPGVALELPEARPAVAADVRAVPVRYGGSGKVKVTAVGGHDGTTDSIEGYRRARRTKTVAVDGDHGSPGQRAKTTAISCDGRTGHRTGPVTGCSEGHIGSPTKDYSPPRRTLAEMLELQGLPADWMDHQPWTMQAKRKMVVNGVPIPMARAIAQAIRKALEQQAA